ncbi:MAG: L-2-hydroxyglutarate oxidase [Saprospiraceae bacterium]
MRHDILIAGAGIVGLATALQLQRQRPDLKIGIIEKEAGLAAHQSSHNSGVIHSGIYYKPNSLRATNCLRGYKLLLEFCQEQGVPFDVCGKLIAAVDNSELEGLERIFQRGKENGLKGLKKISGEKAKEIEPNLECKEAVWVPQAGIVSYAAVASQYARIFEVNGGEIYLKQKVVAIRQGSKQVEVDTDKNNGTTWNAKVFVNCTGLYSDKVAKMLGGKAPAQILPFRGEYYDLVPERQHLVKNLIYPVPNPSFPFLGVHLTRMIEGGIEAGPNAVLAFRREGYSRWDLNIKELSETLVFPGFRKIAAKYWRDGWAEMKRSYFKSHFTKAIQRLVPEISEKDLVPGRSGVRAMACDAEGNLIDDFLIQSNSRIVNVLNAPSPAATASLAIGETIAAKVLEQC